MITREDIYRACENGDLETIEAAVDKAVDPKSALVTVMFASADLLYEEGLEFAVAHHVDVNTRRPVPAMMQDTPLLRVVWGGHIEMSKKLLEAGAEVDFRAFSSDTPLMIAAKKGFTEIVALLLAAGACKELRNSDGLTAAELARNNGHIHLADFVDGASIH